MQDVAPSRSTPIPYVHYVRTPNWITLKIEGIELPNFWLVRCLHWSHIMLCRVIQAHLSSK